MEAPMSLRSLLLPAMAATLLAANARAADLAPVPADITVAADGSGQFTSIQKALDSIPKDNKDRIVIFIKDGVYKEKIRVDPNFITLRGQSREGTRIEYPQTDADYQAHRDDLGLASFNLGAPLRGAATTRPSDSSAAGPISVREDFSLPTGSDCIIQNLTLKNTAGIQNHSRTVYTDVSDHLIITDADILSEGNDTLSPMNGSYHGGGHYYFSRLNVRGGVDFVCPKGWCYLADSHLTEVRATASATVWHNGSGGKDQKLVLRRVTFSGPDQFKFARHHVDAAFYFLDCTVDQNMADKGPFLVRYPDNKAQEAANDRLYRWGPRYYFFNVHRKNGDDFPWMKDNLDTAPGSPTSAQITAAWTFANTWNPERTDKPTIRSIAWDPAAQKVHLTFSEPVTVKGRPTLLVSPLPPAQTDQREVAFYSSGSGTSTLLFSTTASSKGAVVSFGLNGGLILATQATVSPRYADLSLPK
jgi:pectinesterase